MKAQLCSSHTVNLKKWRQAVLPIAM